MSVADLRILRHMLGIDDPSVRDPKPYRNYFAANPGDADMARLVAAGLVEHYGDRFGLEYYRCTEAGKSAAMASQRAMRWTKAKRVYARYLSVSDTAHDLTFKQFITDPQFADIRREA